MGLADGEAFEKTYGTNTDRVTFFDEANNDYKEVELKDDVDDVVHSGGMKFDMGKLDPQLLSEGCPHALSEIDAVLAYGAQKYEAHSWKSVPDAARRYAAAAARHKRAMDRGELYDEESGLRHAAHMVCNLLFVMELTSEFGTLEFNKVDPKFLAMKKVVQNGG